MVTDSMLVPMMQVRIVRMAMESSPIYLLRQVMVLLKATVCFCYGAHRDVRDAIGYPLQHDDPRRKGPA